jgi:hypothetical protein
MSIEVPRSIVRATRSTVRATRSIIVVVTVADVVVL